MSTNKTEKRIQKLLELEEIKSWRLIMQTFKLIFSKLEGGLLAENCSVSRFQVLFYLYTNPPLAAVDIAKLLLVTRGNISTFLRRLEKDGLVESFFGPGKKRPLYKLTLEGKELFETIFPNHVERVKKIVPGLSKKTYSELEVIVKNLS